MNLPIEQSKYKELQKFDYSKSVLYDILLSETFRWSQHVENWFTKRSLTHILNDIFPGKEYNELDSISMRKWLFDFCKGKPPICSICNKCETKLFTFKVGYQMTCSEKCYNIYKSNRQLGDGNTSKRMSKETRERSKIKQSISIKKSILDGKFTPCITNSWSNSRCRLKLNGCEHKFRSTWEAMFWLITKLPYEKVRIEYTNEKGANSVYIVDFHDEIEKKLYEIKPKSNKSSKKCILKSKAAKKWAKENGYKYVYITEKYLVKNKDIILGLTSNEKILKALERLEYEDKKNTKNRKK